SRPTTTVARSGGPMSKNELSSPRLPRRDFLKASSIGLAAAVPAQLAGLRSATDADTRGLVGDGGRRRILLRNGVVLSLDSKVGDFEKADVLIDGTKISAVGPNLAAGNADGLDC